MVVKLICELKISDKLEVSNCGIIWDTIMGKKLTFRCLVSTIVDVPHR